jgi:mannose-6-phosphate isomerase-like protein (cupin superfamily)
MEIDEWLGPGIKRVNKGWGWEDWIYNSAYCGKLLHFHKGKRLSYHYHILKDETFYLHTGSIRLLVSEGDDISQAKEVMLKPGDSYHIPPGLRHQMIALEDSDLFEFSTRHFDSDSYRIIKGD